MKDKKTKYRLPAVLSKKKDYSSGAKKLFSLLKKNCGSQFLEWKKLGMKIDIISDGCESYKKAHNKFFRNVADLTFGVPIARKKHRLKHNNNCIERDHQYLRQRYKIMRGFKSFESAEAINALLDVHYNFLDEQQLKNEKRSRTPAQRAGIDFKLGRRYKLLKLIQIAQGTEE